MTLNKEIFELIKLDLEARGAHVTFIAEVINRTVEWKIKADWGSGYPPWVVEAYDIVPNKEE